MDNQENCKAKDLEESVVGSGNFGSPRPCGGTRACGSGGACSDTIESNDDEDETEPLSRGDFIRMAFGGTVLLWGGVALAPIVAYLTPPPGESEESSKITSVEVCKLSELPKGSGRNFRFGSFPALVVHDQDGNLHAFKAICTHLGCTVQFRSDKQCIYCACHGGVYDAVTGKNVAGPPPKPLPSLKVSVENDKIVVSKA